MFSFHFWHFHGNTKKGKKSKTTAHTGNRVILEAQRAQKQQYSAVMSLKVSNMKFYYLEMTAKSQSKH